MKRMWIACAAGLLASCGTIGPPMAPEDVGVAPLIEQQQRRDALDARQREAIDAPVTGEPQGQDVNLPPLRPVGTR